MDLKELTERWNRNLVQAAHFAETDNLTDAVARARLVVAEVEAALKDASATEIASLEAAKIRASRAAAAHEAAYRSWAEGVRSRENAFEDREHEAYDQPLPVRSQG